MSMARKKIENKDAVLVDTILTSREERHCNLRKPTEEEKVKGQN